MSERFGMRMHEPVGGSQGVNYIRLLVIAVQIGYRLHMAEVPMKPDLLRWAMEEANSSPEDLARVTKRDIATVNSWLEGVRIPTKGDAQALAKRLGRSRYFFFLPRVPERQPVQVWYRSAIRGEPEDETRELNEVRAARQRQEAARWALEKLETTKPVVLPRLSHRPEDAAQELHELLQWDTRSDQIATNAKNTTFKKLRLHVENLGVMVQLRDLGEGNSRGFSLPDHLIPTIVINSSHALGSVRSFTLLHELAHLTRGEERVCYDRDSGEEAYCNRVAANFLMPRHSLLEYIEYKNWNHIGDSDTDSVRLIANRYNTSWFSVAIRLNELGIASPGLIETVRAGRRTEWQAGRQSGGGPGAEPYSRPQRRFDEFGSTYTAAILSARDAGVLSELETRRRLRVNSSELSDVALLARTYAS